MSKKIAYILFVAGLLLIIAGLVLQVYKDKKEIDKKQQLITNQAQEIIKLRTENEALWDNYYMNVTNYEGYEYYE